MNIKDLENELNKLDENFAFQIEQAEKDDTKASKDGENIIVQGVKAGEIWVRAKTANMSDFEIILFKLLPPDDDYDFWRIDTDGNIEQWDLVSFAVYVKALQLAQKFMAENSAKD